MSIINAIAHKVSGFNRNRKLKSFFNIINPLPNDTILDVGYTDKEYSPIDNFLEKHYPYKNKITALGIEKPIEFAVKYPEVKVILYDGSIFPFEDNSFEIGWANAVIEHVGNYDKQVLFIKELSRTCKKIYFTTPNRYFPIEVHTRIPLLHFLPKTTFDQFLKLIGKKWATGSYMNLLSKKKLKKILSDAGIKNYSIIENKLAFFTLDFVVVIKNN
jgi:SAM-dependent methyltransferase